MIEQKLSNVSLLNWCSSWYYYYYFILFWRFYHNSFSHLRPFLVQDSHQLKTITKNDWYWKYECKVYHFFPPFIISISVKPSSAIFCVEYAEVYDQCCNEADWIAYNKVYHLSNFLRILFAVHARIVTNVTPIIIERMYNT